MILVYLNQTEWLSRQISVFFFIDISNKNSMEIEREHKKFTQCHPKIPTRCFYIKNVPFGSIIFPNLDMFDTQIMVYAEKTFPFPHLIYKFYHILSSFNPGNRPLLIFIRQLRDILLSSVYHTKVPPTRHKCSC